MSEKTKQVDIDGLVKKHTAFTTMQELLDAPGGYFPSLYTFHREIKKIADEYDRRQEARGDARRAFRHSSSGSTNSYPNGRWTEVERTQMVKAITLA